MLLTTWELKTIPLSVLKKKYEQAFEKTCEMYEKIEQAKTEAEYHKLRYFEALEYIEKEATNGQMD